MVIMAKYGEVTSKYHLIFIDIVYQRIHNPIKIIKLFLAFQIHILIHPVVFIIHLLFYITQIEISVIHNCLQYRS